MHVGSLATPKKIFCEHIKKTFFRHQKTILKVRMQPARHATRVVRCVIKNTKLILFFDVSDGVDGAVTVRAARAATVGSTAAAVGGAEQLRQARQLDRVRPQLGTPGAGHPGRQGDQAGRPVAGHLPEPHQSRPQLRRRLHAGRPPVRGALLRHRVRRLRPKLRVPGGRQGRLVLQARAPPQRMRDAPGEETLLANFPYYCTPIFPYHHTL